MPVEGKELALLAGVAVGSLIAGSFIGYHFASNKSVVRNLSTANRRQEPVNKYVAEISLREPEILKELREYTQQYVDRSTMLTDPVQTQLFQLLLSSINAKKCMEVGTYTGYNALNCALTIPDDGTVYALDVSDEYVSKGKQFFKKSNVGHKIDIRIGPAVVTMDHLINDGHSGTFDFIYIDADKENYDNYYEKGLLLLRRGGIIALDNMLQRGRVVDMTQYMTPDYRRAAEAIHKLNEKIKIDSRVQLSFLNIADGVSLCRKI